MLNHEGLLLNAPEELACAIESLPWLPPPRLHIVDAAMVPVLELLPPRISSAVGKRRISANGDVPLLMGGFQRMVMFPFSLPTSHTEPHAARWSRGVLP